MQVLDCPPLMTFALATQFHINLLLLVWAFSVIVQLYRLIVYSTSQAWGLHVSSVKTEDSMSPPCQNINYNTTQSRATHTTVTDLTRGWRLCFQLRKLIFVPVYRLVKCLGVTEDIVIVSWVAGVSLLTLARGDTSFLNICLLGFIFTKYMSHTVIKRFANTNHILSFTSSFFLNLKT